MSDPIENDRPIDEWDIDDPLKKLLQSPDVKFKVPQIPEEKRREIFRRFLNEKLGSTADEPTIVTKETGTEQ